MTRSLLDYCTVNTPSGDSFVGIRHDNDRLKINFPLGYNLSSNNLEIRKDILNLLSLLKEQEKKESRIDKINNIQKSDDITNFPLKSYLFIVRSFLSTGYYRENKSDYTRAKKGNIVWNKTIQREKKYIDEQSIYFLDFTIKKRTIKDNALITKIHKYCVYKSFEKIGWLYSEIKPQKPFIEFNKKLFIQVIRDYLDNTFNDEDVRLFRSMINVINSIENISKEKDWYYGTFKFEYTWEYAIDKVLGIEDKSEFFPRTIWHIKEENQVKINRPLMPDTVMKIGEDIYILDAKYYKFGITYNKHDLPNTASIYKQIAYGEYIYNKYNLEIVYNLFLLPYGSSVPSERLRYIGYSEITGDRRSNKNIYEFVYAIMLDTKQIIDLSINNNPFSINELKNEIKNIVTLNAQKDFN